MIRLTGARERPCTAEDALGAAEAFLASTTRDVQSIAAIDEREFPQTGERTAQAATAFRAHVEESLR